jgi:hypothetical protein
MKVKKLIRKMYKAIIRADKEAERKFYFKILKKSIKHKHTQAVQ